MKSGIALTITIAGFLIAIVALVVSLASRFDGSAEQTCKNYEEQGVIPKNSCYCSTQIYRSWSESYDWKDACAILESRKNLVNNHE